MTGQELASYYRAAVEYIDPRLREDCPIEDICSAAKARQRALAAHDSETARLEYGKIEEALEFIRRAHPQVAEICREHAAQDSNGPETTVDEAQAVPQTAQNGNGNGSTNGNGNGNGNGHGAASSVYEHVEEAAQAEYENEPLEAAMETQVAEDIAPSDMALADVVLDMADAEVVEEVEPEADATQDSVQEEDMAEDLPGLETETAAIAELAAESAEDEIAEDEEYVELVIGAAVDSSEAQADNEIELAAEEQADIESAVDQNKVDEQDSVEVLVAAESEVSPADSADPVDNENEVVNEEETLAAIEQPQAEVPEDAMLASSVGQKLQAGNAAEALADAMNSEREEQAPAISRHQFIEELHKRRELQLEQKQAQTAELLSELQDETQPERVQAIIESVPDVIQTLEKELQQEQARQKPLDFRSMMQQATGQDLPAVRPASRRRLRTEEILKRERTIQQIPEEHAAPILLGILLIIWQFSTALLAGYALCRLLLWPFGTAFSSMSPLKAMFACLVGIGGAALIGAWFRIYRLRSRKLSLPTHVTAVSMLMLVLAWQLNASANGYATAPPLWLWCVMFAGWLVATIAAGLHDLRVPPQHSEEKQQMLPVEPLPH